MMFMLESFGMTKLHKDIAMKLMDSVNNEEYTDQAIVKVCYISVLLSLLMYRSCLLKQKI